MLLNFAQQHGATIVHQLTWGPMVAFFTWYTARAFYFIQ